ncbi:hypothetical protein PFLUV_G00135970 [Perca fluviatilis]|uniref:Uncharacterized protein n=1 Tax=Perca fluviatilis TaxID=8168 RepID=A0A6A5E4V9_PERFL|nr:hypothetical protein PFLUV_G00135970 [Perca fluviatilis]
MTMNHQTVITSGVPEKEEVPLPALYKDKRIHCSGVGIQRIQTRPQQLRQVERRKSCAHKQDRKKEEGKNCEREKN